MAAAIGRVAAHARLGPASLVLYDVSTLYYEAHQGDGFREPGFSKERRLEPQVTIGLLTDQSGFPLMLSAFEGNKAETKTMLPVIRQFTAAYALSDVTVVADAGMISDANMKAIEAAGLSFILGMKVPDVPYVIDAWRRYQVTVGRQAICITAAIGALVPGGQEKAWAGCISALALGGVDAFTATLACAEAVYG